ncbi:hypothetical protein [Mesorhizobium sp. M1136]|uniref:hypothetical protein n=1 Tax=unclassified Mesorhizobium TaxID=325217 RepID=UPI00333DF041
MTTHNGQGSAIFEVMEFFGNGDLFLVAMPRGQSIEQFLETSIRAVAPVMPWLQRGQRCHPS